MDKKLKAAADAVREAIKDRDPKGYSEINLTDVGRVIESIPKADRDAADWINDLHIGVRNNPRNTKALQTTGHLGELLDLFDAVHAPAPGPSAPEPVTPAVPDGEPVGPDPVLPPDASKA